MNKRIKRYINVLLGLLIVSATFNLFLLPNNLAAIGISGLGMLFTDLYGIDLSLFVLLSNIILIILSYLVMDIKTTKRTIIGALLSPLFLKLTFPLSYMFDLSSVDTIFQAIFGGVLSGVGYGMIFKQGYTSGGTDIVNQLMSVSYKIPLNNCIILCDGLIVLLGGLVFGLEPMVYSIIVLILISFYSHKTIIGSGQNKTFFIYTKNPEQIKDYLLNTIKNDITIINGEGGHSKDKVHILFSVINSFEYFKVKSGIELIDPKAFIVLTNAHELVNSNLSIRGH